MSDIGYQFQASFKFGPQYKEALVNVPAQSPEELAQKLEWLTENAAKFVAAQTALLAVSEVAPLAGNVTSTQVENTPAPAPQQAQGGWGGQQAQQPPSFAQPASNAPACQHGPMVYREAKPGSGKDWKAYFCPTPQNTPGQCKPQFIK